MQVKLALALALAHRPPLLILDEPTSGLDPVARREFLEIIRHQARHDGRTTFFSSHLIDEVERVADRVGIIHKGKLRYEGAIPALQELVREVLAAPETETPGETESAASLSREPDVRDESAPEVVVAEAVDVTVLPTEEVPAAFPTQLPAAAATDPMRELAALAAESGLTVLREGLDERPSLILAGSQEAWRQAPLAPERIRPLSLEDIFIALASEVHFGPAAEGANIAR
jgi:ABC-type multidrug transport system ATPase subunit